MQHRRYQLGRLLPLKNPASPGPARRCGRCAGSVRSGTESTRLYAGRRLTIPRSAVRLRAPPFRNSRDRFLGRARAGLAGLDPADASSASTARSARAGECARKQPAGLTAPAPWRVAQSSTATSTSTTSLADESEEDRTEGDGPNCERSRAAPRSPARLPMAERARPHVSQGCKPRREGLHGARLPLPCTASTRGEWQIYRLVSGDR